MNTFVLGAVALTALALAFVLPTLWRGERRTALVLALLLPAITAGLYLKFGEPDALQPRNLAPPATLDEAIAQLERRLEKDPDNLEGWVLLGRSRKAQDNFPAAAQALGRAYELAANEPDLKIEYAEALSLADAERRFNDTAVGLLDAALADRPNHPRGLWLRGVAAYQRGDVPGALSRWEALLPKVDAETAAALREEINTVRAGAGLPPLGDTAAAAPDTTAVAGPSVTVTVQVDEALATNMPPEAVLFVIARRPGMAAGPPLAARRVAGPQFPLSITLTDADSPMPAGKLSDAPSVAVSARWARSGSVQPVEGDLLANPVEVDVGNAAPVELRLVAPGP